MKHLLVLCCIALSFYNFSGCGGRCDSITRTNSGELTEQALAMVPYEHGDTIHVIHSNGSLFHFVVSRTSHIDEFSEECFTHTSHQDISILEPSYPLFSPNITIYQQDSLHFNISVYIQKKHAYIIPNEWNIDTLHIQSKQYTQVWGLQMVTEFPESGIQIDSLYYNVSHGILRITMTNGEWYERKK